MSTTEHESPGESPDLIHRIASLTRMLRDSMRELGLDQAIKDAANAIPDARDRLRQHRIGLQRRRRRHHPQQGDGQMMRALGVEGEEQGTDPAVGMAAAMPAPGAFVESLLRFGNR